MADPRFCPQCGETCGPNAAFCTSCGTVLRPTTPRTGGRAAETPNPLDLAQTELGLSPNTVLLNRYRIQKELGAGGMGRVYAAEDQQLGIPVAVKVMRDILRQDPGSVRRLITEAKASILLAHPNIVRMHNFEDGETTKFLVMEYVDGETLAHKIAREGKVAPDEARRIAIEVCKGLEHAHAKKVIHRDLKPGNILLGKDGSVKVADFGIARLCRDSVSRLTSHQDSGTLMYMSPEQLDGETGESGDLYALGVVLYEMLSGDPPFVTGEITAQIRYKAPKEIPGIPPEWNRLVLKCLEKKPANRFSGLRELREELDGSAAGRRRQESQVEQRLAQLKAEGSRAGDEGRCADAVALWQEALALRPGDAELESRVAEARQRKAMMDESEARARRAEEEATERRKQEEGILLERYNALKAQGSAALNAGKHAEAIGFWQQALALKPGDAGLRDSISAAKTQADLARQEAERRQTAEARQKWLESALAQVRAATSQGRYREAEGMLHQALQYDPGNAVLTAELQKCRESLKEAEKQGEKSADMAKRPKPLPLKKILLYVAVPAALLLAVIVYVAVDQYDQGSRISSPPPPDDTGSVKKSTDTYNPPPSPDDTGKESAEKIPEDSIGKGKGKPPVDEPVQINVTGRWAYSLQNPDGRLIYGELQINDLGGMLQLTAAAAYSMLWTDGLIHQFREQSSWVGRVYGNRLDAETGQVNYMMDGYQIPSNRGRWQMSLSVAPDGSYMEGQVKDMYDRIGRVTARR